MENTVFNENCLCITFIGTGLMRGGSRVARGGVHPGSKHIEQGVWGCSPLEAKAIFICFRDKNFDVEWFYTPQMYSFLRGMIKSRDM